MILFSINIYIQNQTEIQRSSLAQSERQFLESENQEFQDGINRANSILSQLDSFYSQKTYFSEIVQKISKILPQDCFLTNLSMIFSIEEETKEESIKISISGFAPMREDLLQLKKNLEQEENFKDISFPPANWVEPKNIDFYITFNIK